MIAGQPSKSSVADGMPEFAVSIIEERLEFTNFEDAIERRQPHIILVDAASGQNRNKVLQFLRGVRRSFPELRCILLIDDSDISFVVSAFQCGARGLLVGDQLTTDLLAKCIRCVHNGQIWISNEVLAHVLDAFSRTAPLRVMHGREGLLSPREQQVLGLVVRGLSNREIAEALSVTENTVKKYVYEVFNKTGTSSRVELVLQALQAQSAA
jgi:DNA-binding NarL/FixJ family response regulator